MRSPFLTLLISTTLMFTPTPSLNTEKANFDEFIGNWTGKGTLFGAEANFKMSWKRTVDDKFIELNFENRFKTANGEQKLTAKAIYWFTDEENLKGNWYDSRGFVFPLKAEFKNKTLTSLWGDSDSVEKGKTVYQLTDKAITVQDYVWRDGEMSPFGSSVYEKVN